MRNWPDRGGARRPAVYIFLLTLFASIALAAPMRIVSTGPGITEILFALGLGNRTVGVTDYCNYPEAAKKLPRIGSWMKPNTEVILSLRPDLVVVQRTAVYDASRFQQLKLRTVEVHLDRVSDIFTAITTIGNAADAGDRAADLNRTLRTALDAIRARVAGRPPTSVLFVVGRNPGSLDGMYAVGPGSYLSELIDIAGGRNVLSDASAAYVKVSREELLVRKPEVILDMGEGDHPGDVSVWKPLANIPAVQNHRVRMLASDVFVVPGPRVTECARHIARMLHPGLPQ